MMKGKMMEEKTRLPVLLDHSIIFIYTGVDARAKTEEPSTGCGR